MMRMSRLSISVPGTASSTIASGICISAKHASKSVHPNSVRSNFTCCRL
jgi:hypothetical protein